MADQDPINPNNGQGPAGGPEDAPQATSIAQYIKDLSVESPNSPQIFQWQEQPQVDVQFNINVNRVSEDVHEVVLHVNVGAKSDKGTHFLVDLSYGGLFGFRNVSEAEATPFLLVEAPRLLFPFARQVIAEAVMNTGFPPLLLEPIDFGAAFMAQMDAARAGAGGGNGGDGQALPPGTPAGDDNQG